MDRSGLRYSYWLLGIEGLHWPHRRCTVDLIIGTLLIGMLPVFYIILGTMFVAVGCITRYSHRQQVGWLVGTVPVGPPREARPLWGFATVERETSPSTAWAAPRVGPRTGYVGKDGRLMATPSCSECGGMRWVRYFSETTDGNLEEAFRLFPCNYEPETPQGEPARAGSEHVETAAGGLASPPHRGAQNH